MNATKTCSLCGTELPPDAPGGHCPQCLMRLGLRFENTDVIPIAEKSGDKIGRYRLLEQIGEGGCGVVYLAEQEEPVRRHVALKIIKLGMDTKTVIARFEGERQALALMDYPNIAKVFDAGATDTGRPYFVMELVRGVKITDYCNAQKLSIRQRLDLFIQVCQAIQHAHQKGIIHRDIKPSNVLVTEQDGLAVPKIIDFGIAKATTGQRLTDKTFFTAFEQFIGTPAYMSPEQAGLSGLDIDTRSDIYSLGVLLYELLTGHQPFDSSELHRAALDEVLLTLREKEPPRPSAKLTSLTKRELTLAAERHQVAPAKLSGLLRGDLDWIVMKALDKDRRRRYETATGFAADIQRHLKNEPVVARPPGAVYRFQKMVRRNKVVVAALACVALALIVGSVVSISQAVRAIRAEQAKARLYDEAEKARREAEAARNNESKLRQEAESARASEASLRQQAEAGREYEAQLRHRAEAHVKIEQAQILCDSGKYDEAENLLNEIDPALIEPSWGHAVLRRNLAWQHIVRNQWDRVVTNIAILLQVNGHSKSFDSASDNYLYANALVLTSDQAGYDRFRQSLIKHSNGTTNAELSKFLCELTTLMPADEKLVASLKGFYDLAESQLKYSASGFQDHEVVRRYSLALVDYRRGNYAQVVERCESCKTERQKNASHLPAVLALNAMASHQLQQDDKSRLELASAHRLFDPVMKKGPSAYTAATMGNWMEWVEAQNLMREADALIGAGNSAPASDAKAKVN